MPVLVAWIGGLYVILKTVRWTVGSRGGYREDAISLSAQLARGEPWLAIAAIALPVSVHAYSHWWMHRRATRGLAHAVDCIGQLGAADRMPGTGRGHSRSVIADSALGYNALALDFGGRLGLRQHQVYRLIDAANRAHAPARGGDTPTVAGIDACVRDDWPHDELLNP